MGLSDGARVIGFDCNCQGVCLSFVESNVSSFIRDLIWWKWINFGDSLEQTELFFSFDKATGQLERKKSEIKTWGAFRIICSTLVNHFSILNSSKKCGWF